MAQRRGGSAVSEPYLAQRPKIGATPTFRKQTGSGAKWPVPRPFRPALRGGVASGEPPLYPAQKSNLCTALGGPGPPTRNSGPQGADTAFQGWEVYGCYHPLRSAANALKGADTGENGGRAAPLARNGLLHCPFGRSHHWAAGRNHVGSFLFHQLVLQALREDTPPILPVHMVGKRGLPCGQAHIVDRIRLPASFSVNLRVRFDQSMLSGWKAWYAAVDMSFMG